MSTFGLMVPTLFEGVVFCREAAMTMTISSDRIVMLPSSFMALTNRICALARSVAF